MALAVPLAELKQVKFVKLGIPTESSEGWLSGKLTLTMQPLASITMRLWLPALRFIA